MRVGWQLQPPGRRKLGVHHQQLAGLGALHQQLVGLGALHQPAAGRHGQNLTNRAKRQRGGVGSNNPVTQEVCHQPATAPAGTSGPTLSL